IAESVLNNGVHVLSEAIPGVRSVAVGVWIRQGSAHESPGEMGVSHLLEHMAFKGTRRRSPREIALALEGLGGSLDAYTSREHTSFQARALDEHLGEALDVVADVVFSPLLRDEDLELEREVVLEEISTVEDTPDDLVFDLHGERLWQGHAYGQPILGTRETVSSVTAEGIRALHRERYRGDNLVVAAAGNVSHTEVVERVSELLGDVAPGERRGPLISPGPIRTGEERVIRDSAQTHVVFGTDLVPHSDPRRYVLVLLAAAFGGGMSSRLFQRVREELALAYTVFSFQSFYSAGGMGGVYVGTRPEGEERTVDAVREEYARLAADGLSDVELEQTKRQVKGQIMLSLESTGSRLYRLAGFALYDEPYLDLDDLLARIDAITPAEVRAAAADFFDPARQFVLRLGPDV
ncbi:MAG TPA: pitrilysin family protein, partial [Longimicrobiales bacterium]|nr:pitrilysin family protein [Longimicrobiales bacterium]